MIESARLGQTSPPPPPASADEINEGHVAAQVAALHRRIELLGPERQKRELAIAATVARAVALKRDGGDAAAVVRANQRAGRQRREASRIDAEIETLHDLVQARLARVRRPSWRWLD